MNAKQKHLDQLLAKLQRHSQRAIYKAVGGIVGLPALSVMKGRPKSKLNSWVVSKDNGLPTGYRKSERDGNLEDHDEVICDPNELAMWLRKHP